MKDQSKKWFRILVLVVVALLLALLYTVIENRNSSPENPSGTPVQIDESALDTGALVAVRPRPMTADEAVVEINEKYESGLGIKIVATNTARVWFAREHETEGCNKYRYMDLATGEEIQSDLVACPMIEISHSYPYYIEDCSIYPCYDFRTLYVVDLLSLKRRAVHALASEEETTIEGCYETNFDPICRTKISIANGKLRIPVYKKTERKPFEVYTNSELLRVDEVDLSTEFGNK